MTDENYQLSIFMRILKKITKYSIIKLFFQYCMKRTADIIITIAERRRGWILNTLHRHSRILLQNDNIEGVIRQENGNLHRKNKISVFDFWRSPFFSILMVDYMMMSRNYGIYRRKLLDTRKVSKMLECHHTIPRNAVKIEADMNANLTRLKLYHLRS